MDSLNYNPTAYIAKGAVVIGKVCMGDYVSIWFNAVVRADGDTIYIGEGTNVQDNCTLHLDPGGKLEIGNYVTIGHNAIVHGCKVGDNTLIGMGAIVMNHAVIGKNCIIGAGAVVTEGVVIPDNSMVLGCPGRIRRQVTPEEAERNHKNALHYVNEAMEYKMAFQSGQILL